MKSSVRGGHNLRYIPHSPRCVPAEHCYLLRRNFIENNKQRDRKIGLSNNNYLAR